jgi:hypothetical protein
LRVACAEEEGAVRAELAGLRGDRVWVIESVGGISGLGVKPKPAKTGQNQANIGKIGTKIPKNLWKSGFFG